MTKKITTYDEMLEEEERLKQLLGAQKLQLQYDIHGIEEELRPLTNFTQTVKKFLTRKGGQAATTVGIKLLVDGLVKNLLLSKAGWLTRFAVPFFLKNYASHLANEPGKLMSKIKHMFGKNGKTVKPE
jgi:hypothetical protein